MQATRVHNITITITANSTSTGTGTRGTCIATHVRSCRMTSTRSAVGIRSCSGGRERDKDVQQPAGEGHVGALRLRRHGVPPAVPSRRGHIRGPRGTERHAASRRWAVFAAGGSVRRAAAPNQLANALDVRQHRDAGAGQRQPLVRRHHRAHASRCISGQLGLQERPEQRANAGRCGQRAVARPRPPCER